MPFVSCWVVGATPSQLMALLPLLRASAASLRVAHKVTQGKPTADTDTAASAAASAAAAAAAAAANDDTGDDNRTCSSVAVLSGRPFTGIPPLLYSHSFGIVSDPSAGGEG